MSNVKIYTATPADLSPPVQSESFCVDLVLASDYRELEAKCASLVEALEHYKSREERVTKLVLGNSVSWEELFKQIEEAKQRIASLESRIVTVKLPEDRADSDVSSRNQPGMVVAVHIDAGDFVKVYGQVFEVEETDFDDHDVTLWFVGGNALRCAAGCQVEVVAVPDAVGIQVIEGEGQ